jgi:hypothetical protein
MARPGTRSFMKDPLMEDTPDGPADGVLDGLPAEDGSAEPGDRSPGDGTVEPAPATGDADHLRGAERGREAEAARADTSDSLPVPTETPAE